MFNVNKGIIVEYRGNRAIILTPEGEFKCISLPKGKYDIGQEVELRWRNTYSFYRWGVAAALLILALVATFLAANFAVDQRVYAYVQLDINPSAEFTVNKQGRIIDVKPLNDEGEQVLEGAKFEGKKLEQGIRYFTQRSYELGLVRADVESHIIVTTIVEGEQQGLQVDKKAVQTVETVVEDKHIPAKVSAFITTKEIRQEARKAGISSGKYLILLQASEEGIEISPEDVVKQPIYSAIRKAGGNISHIIREAAKNNKEEQKALLKKYREKVRNHTKGKHEKDKKNEGDPGGKESSSEVKKTLKEKEKTKNGGQNKQNKVRAPGNKDKEQRNSGENNPAKKEREKEEGSASQQKKLIDREESREKVEESKGSKDPEKPGNKSKVKDGNNKSKGRPGKGASNKKGVNDKTTMVQDIIMSLFDN